LSLWIVRALPKNSRMGLDCKTCCSMERQAFESELDRAPGGVGRMINGS
jgi:hypothetical protein